MWCEEGKETPALDVENCRDFGFDVLFLFICFPDSMITSIIFKILFLCVINI